MAHFLPAKVTKNLQTKPEASPVSFKSPIPKESKSRALRSSSIGDWWKRNMSSSLRPDSDHIVSGHHLDHGGVHLGEPSNQKPTQPAVAGHQRGRGGTGDSDRLTRWNVPKDLSADLSDSPQSRKLPSLNRVNLATAADRKKSWFPGDDQEPHSPLEIQPNPRTKITWQDHQTDHSAASSKIDHAQAVAASLAADRRISNVRRAIEAKKEARRQRRSLKESGDYLGVMGANPQTGEVDPVSSTDSEDSGAKEIEKNLTALAYFPKNIRDASEKPLAQKGRGARRSTLTKEKEKLARQHEKEEVMAQKRGWRWRRETKQWVSVQEPELSPIAQSQRSFMPISRRPSLPTKDACLSPEALIDIASSPEARYIEGQLQLPQVSDRSGIASRSSGTVVHTPHRRSSAVAKSAAMELFENDISFSSENAHTSYAGTDHLEAPESDELGSFHGERGNINLESQPPNLKESLNFGGHQGSEPIGKSFLEQSALGEVRPKSLGLGRLPRPVSTADLLTSAKIRGPTRSFSQIPEMYRQSKSTDPRLNSYEDLSNVSVIDHNPSIKRSLTDWRLLVKEHTPLREGTQLLKLSPKQLLHQMKKKRDRHQGSSQRHQEGEVASDQHLKSLTNLQRVGKEHKYQTSTNPCPQIPDSTGTISTPANIRRDIDFLKLGLAKIDDRHKLIDSPVSSRLSADHDWVEDTIQNIRGVGKEDTETAASTPITTTTGYDPLTSATNLSQRSISSLAMRGQLQLSKRHSFSSTSEAIDALTYRPKIDSSTLLSLTPEGQIVPNDISSTICPVVVKSAELSPTGRLISHNNELKVRHHRHSISPTYMSALAKSNKNTHAKALNLFKKHKANKDRKFYIPQTPRQHRILTKVGTSDRDPHELRDVGLHLTPASGAQWSELIPMDRVNDLMKGCPGAFPSHLNGGGGIAAPFAKTFPKITYSRQWKTSAKDLYSIWATVVDFCFIVRCHVVVFVRLYWGLTKPVFDRSSEYWLRSAAGTSTFMDGVVFVLALPGAFVGLLGFI